ncbi:MAG: type I restriction enzyme HsdR N-terminal domain-containing protein [Deltaproteobacteria bacterium]|nr:type I restriction enzyme HsdR N-terminal domain-containing protein [Candidatus Tharpella aukensis]
MEPKNYQEIWQEICFILSDSVKENISEKDFEHQVLRALEVLGWREFKGEIERQILIQVGRQGILKPDLVVYGERKKALIVIEVKRPQEDISRDDSISQLKSYMRQMKADFGFLVGNQIRIYYDGNLNPQADPLLIDKIPYLKDEKAGVSFAELFEKSNFQSEFYLPILKKKIRKFNIKRESQKLKTILLSKDTKIKILEFLEKEFADYDSDIFASVMSEINISLESNPAHHTNQPAVVPPVERHKRRIVRPTTPPNTSISGKTYSLSELKNMHLGKEYRPASLIIQGHTIEVSNWTDLSLKFVEWLIKSNFLTKSKLPIYNYSESDKYFINSSPRHEIAEKDGQWKSVMGNFHVDTKYNADCHKKNMIQALNHLGIFDVDIKITFR